MLFGYHNSISLTRATDQVNNVLLPFYDLRILYKKAVVFLRQSQVDSESYFNLDIVPWGNIWPGNALVAGGLGNFGLDVRRFCFYYHKRWL